MRKLLCSMGVALLPIAISLPAAATTYETTGAYPVSLVSSDEKLLVFDSELLSLQGSDLCPSESGLFGFSSPFTCPLDDTSGLVFQQDTASAGVKVGLIYLDRSTDFSGSVVSAALENAGRITPVAGPTTAGKIWTRADGLAVAEHDGVFYYSKGPAPCVGWDFGSEATCGEGPSVHLSALGEIYAFDQTGALSVPVTLGLSQDSDTLYVQPLNPDYQTRWGNIIPQNQIRCTPTDPRGGKPCWHCEGEYTVPNARNYDLTCLNSCATVEGNAYAACEFTYIQNHNTAQRGQCTAAARRAWRSCRDGCERPVEVRFSFPACAQ